MVASVVSFTNYPSNFSAHLSCAGSQEERSLTQHALGESRSISQGYHTPNSLKLWIRLNCLSLDYWGWIGAPVLPAVLIKKKNVSASYIYLCVWEVSKRFVFYKLKSKHFYFFFKHLEKTETSKQKVKGFLAQLMCSREVFLPPKLIIVQRCIKYTT